MAWIRGKFSSILAVFECIFLVIFIVFVTYDEEADAAKWALSGKTNSVTKYYPMFQDVHVMMYIGFGFLMTFLRRYGYSAISVNMLIASFVVQWHIIMSGLLEMHDGKISVNIITLTTSEFAAAAVLISFGAVLGKTSPLQLIIMAFIEIAVYSVNEHIGVTYLKVVDIGGSMFVHVFGAYFGLAVSRILYDPDVEKSQKEGSVYHADLFSMIGTIFLWLYWPSFNGALAHGDAQHRVVINTYLALSSCAVTTFIMSSLVGGKDAKLDMVHIQNSTLAGGVAVGTCSNLMIQPWGAVLIGIIAAIISVVGFKFLTPAMSSKLKLHDTCGVNNLHGMPGILAAIAGAVVSAIATTKQYGLNLYTIFPARVPLANTTEFADLSHKIANLTAGDGRDALTQGGYQMLNLAITMAMAIVGGILTGLVLKIPFLDQPKEDEMFDDDKFFAVPDEDFAPVLDHAPPEQSEVSKHEGGY